MSEHERLQLTLMLAGMAVFGLCIVFMSLRVLFAKRPLVFSSKPLCYLAILPFVFIIIASFMEGQLSMAGLWLVICVSLFLASRRYVVIGASSEALREALIASLNKLSLPFEEDITGITVTTKNIKLVTNQSRVGGLKIGIKSLEKSRVNRWVEDKSQIALLKSLATELRSYFATTPVEMSLLSRLPLSAILFMCGMSLLIPIFGILLGPQGK